MSDTVKITLNAAASISYAGVQNAIPVVQSIRLVNNSTEALVNLSVIVMAEPDILLRPLIVHVASLAAGTEFNATGSELLLKHDFLMGLEEAVCGFLWAEVRTGEGSVLDTVSTSIELLAYDEWAGYRQLPELLVAFSQPNSRVVATILHHASQKLHTQYSESLNGYQVNDRHAVARQIGAVFTTISEMNIHYSNPPASFTGDGQKIRLPERLQEERLGTCLDLTMFLVSCLEQVGLNPIILLEEGHAWVGCWLHDQSLAIPSVDDRQHIRKRFDTGELIALEVTCLTPQSRAGFAVAVRLGAEKLSDAREPRFDLAIDVRRTRQGMKILPLPVRNRNEGVDAGSASIEIPVELVIENIALPLLATEVIIQSAPAAGLEVGNRIDIWRSRLLDLTLRNKFINFKLTRQYIPLFHPEPALIEDRLADGKALRFVSLNDLLGGTDLRSEDQMVLRTAASFREHAALDAFERGELVVEVPSKELDIRLIEIFRAARTAQEAGGVNTLFLVLGMLQWVDSKDSERRLKAPLVMVPVNLERRSVHGSFSLKRHDDDAIVNPTLVQLLESQFDLVIQGIGSGADLPANGSGVDVLQIWARIRSAVVDIPGFEVLPEACIGLFSFTKYLMWKDLSDRQDLLSSPLVCQLANQQEANTAAFSQMADCFAREVHLDDLKQPQDIYTPIDCDSSQLAAVNAAAEGLDFVLQGPPGTGKSQTITNIIADTLARGKTVLFVSEKIAALSVVHERLKKLGLGPFLLELHSAKATKNAVLVQFQAALSAAAPHSASGWEQEANRISCLRRDLNDYVRTLHHEHCNGLTVFNALALVAEQDDISGCGFDWQDPDTHNQDQLDALRVLVRRLGTQGAMVLDADKEALKRIERRHWSPVWQTEFLAAIADTLKQLDSLRTASEAAVAALGISMFSGSADEYRRFQDLVAMLLHFQPEYGSLLSDSNYSASVTVLQSMTEHAQNRQQAVNQVLPFYSDSVLSLDASELMRLWENAQRYWFFKRWLMQFLLRNKLMAYSKTGRRPALIAVLPLLQHLVTVQREDNALHAQADIASRILGNLWLHNRSDWELIGSASTWLTEFEQCTAALADHNIEYMLTVHSILTQRLIAMGDAFRHTGIIGRTLHNYQHVYIALQQHLVRLADLAASTVDRVVGDVACSNWVGDLSTVLMRWIQSKKHLREWCQWQGVRQAVLAEGMQRFVSSMECYPELNADYAADFFEFSYTSWWLERIVDRTPLLSSFSALDHEQKIKDFCAADERFAILTQKQVYATLAARIPSATLAPRNTPLGILNHELQKKKQHMSVRKLLASLSGVLHRLCPCLLMSPLSVAQYLDASTRFDLVVFDEASQIPTWDAIGAIARGKQVIVVGDPKQLPPTNFFNGSIDEEAIEDLESILEECIGSGWLTHTLKWHYRSRRESLIAFSNVRYYGSQLITFPSPATPDHGLTYHPVCGVYQRSTSRTNRQEAEAIVCFIQQHYANPVQRRRSIGVVTFSQPQQELVENLLDAARRKDVALDTEVSAQTMEPLFIKNLENAQGDERDIILFSVCYGPDETGRVSMNFGPLNRNGGHRRLNVAITRAKEEVHIFATLRPEQIDLSKTKSSGVIDLKHYLEFAIKGPQALLAQSSPTGLPPESPFESQVLAWLQDEGWQVHPQVGCSSYRIDLAVVDPDAPGRYLLAVECDGASYHSAATARDRDKLRQLVLERLGWKVHRIWSTEWWINPDRERSRLRAALNAVRCVTDESEQCGLPDEIADGDTPWSQAYIKENSLVPPHQTISPYIAAHLSTGQRDAFLLPSENAVIEARIRQVVDQEGPVSESVIRRRIFDAYQFERSSPRIQERVHVLLEGCGIHGVDNGRLFLWPSTLDMKNWRSCRQLGGRDVADIHLQELTNLARIVLQELVVADELILIRQMGARLGILRVMASTQARLAQGLKNLEVVGETEHVLGGIRLKR